MQEQLNAAYGGIAKELGLLVAPVGRAWQKDPSPDLWQADGSHPSEMGSYLTACILYATIFRESPEGLPPSSGLSTEAARNLQILAQDTVLKDRRRWHLD